MYFTLQFTMYMTDQHCFTQFQAFQIRIPSIYKNYLYMYIIYNDNKIN